MYHIQSLYSTFFIVITYRVKSPIFCCFLIFCVCYTETAPMVKNWGLHIVHQFVQIWKCIEGSCLLRRVWKITEEILWKESSDSRANLMKIRLRYEAVSPYHFLAHKCPRENYIMLIYTSARTWGGIWVGIRVGIWVGIWVGIRVGIRMRIRIRIRVEIRVRVSSGRGCEAIIYIFR